MCVWGGGRVGGGLLLTACRVTTNPYRAACEDQPFLRYFWVGSDQQLLSKRHFGL